MWDFDREKVWVWCRESGWAKNDAITSHADKDMVWKKMQIADAVLQCGESRNVLDFISHLHQLVISQLQIVDAPFAVSLYKDLLNRY